MGVDPAKWGPGAWRFLHFASMIFPDKPTDAVLGAYRVLFHVLPEVLPCSRCRNHLRKTYRVLPPNIGSRGELIRWVSALHARTNKDLHKRLKNPSFSSQSHGFKIGWRAGLRDFAFSIAFNAPRKRISKDTRAFFTACRKITGPRSLPKLGSAYTKTQLLNTLLKFFKTSKREATEKYRPWLTKRSLASNGRVWPFIERLSRSKTTDGKRSRVSQSKRQLIRKR